MADNTSKLRYNIKEEATSNAFRFLKAAFNDIDLNDNSQNTFKKVQEEPQIDNNIKSIDARLEDMKFSQDAIQRDVNKLLFLTTEIKANIQRIQSQPAITQKQNQQNNNSNSASNSGWDWGKILGGALGGIGSIGAGKSIYDKLKNTGKASSSISKPTSSPTGPKISQSNTLGDQAKNLRAGAKTGLIGLGGMAAKETSDYFFGEGSLVSDVVSGTAAGGIIRPTPFGLIGGAGAGVAQHFLGKDESTKPYADLIGDSLSYSATGAGFGSLLGPAGAAIGGIGGAAIGGGLSLYNNWDKIFGSKGNSTVTSPSENKMKDESIIRQTSSNKNIDMNVTSYDVTSSGAINLEAGQNAEIVFKAQRITFNAEKIEGSSLTGDANSNEQNTSKEEGWFDSFGSFVHKLRKSTDPLSIFKSILPNGGENKSVSPIGTSGATQSYGGTPQGNPNAEVNNTVNTETFAAEERAKFAEELKDPKVVERLKALAIAEVGEKSQIDQQRLMETIFNRAASRKQTLWDTMQKDYYEPLRTNAYENARQRLNKNQNLNDQTSSLLDKVTKGSWAANGTTGNASGNVGFGYGKDSNGNPIHTPAMIKGETKERFDIEKPDLKYSEKRNKEYEEWKKSQQNNSDNKLDISSKNPSDQIMEVGKYLQGLGLRVSEHPAFGGVEPVHKGAGHYDGRAIDVNVGNGVIEADNPEYREKFESIKQELEAKGFKVIFGTGSHKNHMHIEAPTGGVPYNTKRPPELQKNTPIPNETPGEVLRQQSQQQALLERRNKIGAAKSDSERKDSIIIPSAASGGGTFDSDVHPSPTFMAELNSSTSNPPIIKNSSQHSIGLGRQQTLPSFT